MSRFTAPLHVTLSYMPLARLARRPLDHMRLAARPDLGRLPLFGIPGSTAPGAVASRGTAGIAARAILVRVMLAGVSNIAAAASNLMRGKRVRHLGQRRCRCSHAAAQPGDDTDRENVSWDVHGSPPL